ncbi:CSE2-domain-containing protein [Lojkania enalia]|uniref:Mediator of RNA polymerase II transcription subunit 21 n=1 Tax=Lojkania enalia TaxID=147567 RepID=A0A9P4K2N3_9PLEO|nr:CSE2-domain-containing protein [Didymosphaeria enalia]
MADILTQIQDELDMLLLQMTSALHYIKDRAPPAPIPNQPLLTSFTEHESQQRAQDTQSTQPASTQQQGQPTQPTTQHQTQTPTALDPKDFQADIRELSRDLVLKEQQIELLIDRLPGIGTSERAQVERMKELESLLEDMEGERVEAVRLKAEMLERVERRIRGVGGMR